MIANVVDVVIFRSTVLHAAHDATDIRLALRPRSERRRIGQHRFQEMQRHDLLTVEIDRLDARHAHVLQALQMRQVTLPERHEEPDPLDVGNVLRQRLKLLMVDQIHVLRTDLGEVVHAFDLHRFGLDPIAALIVLAVGGHLSNVDLGIEIRRERITMISAVAVENVNRVDRIEMMFQRMSTEHARHARIKAATQQSRQPRRLEPLIIRPLIFVFEIGIALGLVIGGVEIIDARRQARLHDVEIMIRQRKIHHDVGLDALDQRDNLINVIGINPIGRHARRRFAFELRRQRFALGERPTGNTNFVKHRRVFDALVSRHGRHATAADYQSFTQLIVPPPTDYNSLDHITRALSVKRRRNEFPMKIFLASTGFFWYKKAMMNRR